MRLTSCFKPGNRLRALALTSVVVLGLTGIVGSMPSDGIGEDCCDFDWPPGVIVWPRRVTAQVGTAVTFTTETYGTTGSVRFQWRRTSDRGATWTDIPGATGPTYTLDPVRLADDRALIGVRLTAGNGEESSSGFLAVSAYPGVVFEDGEFQPTDWEAVPVAGIGATAPVHSATRAAEGGNPGAYVRMVFEVPQGTDRARVLYKSLGPNYDPLGGGEIYVIDYTEDGVTFGGDGLQVVVSGPLLEQGGRTYVAGVLGGYTLPSAGWSAVASHSTLLPQDFGLIDGPACQSGESCPDFSASGLPLRFGYWRMAYGSPGASIAHGIDNWKVTVWKR